MTLRFTISVIFVLVASACGFRSTKATVAIGDTAAPSGDSAGDETLDTGGTSEDSASVCIDDTADPADPHWISFAGISVVTWDGADGFYAAWPAADGSLPIRYDLIVSDAGGVDLYTVSSTDLSATVRGLADGEYWLRVAAISGDLRADGGVVLHQLMGDNRLVYRSEIPLAGAMDVSGVGNIHVIAGGYNRDVGVYVVDTTDPSAPIIVATLTDIGIVRDIKVGGGLLFTASDSEADGCDPCDGIGIRIFDFSDPSAPALLAEIGEPDAQVHNLSYQAGFLYVTSVSDGAIGVYDVTEPSDPQRIASWKSALRISLFHGGSGDELEETPVPHDQVAIGDRLLVAHMFGFSELNIADPHHPETSWEFFVEMGGHNIWPLRDGIHVATTQEIVGGHLRIWDMSDPDTPVEVASHSTGLDHSIHNVQVVDDLLWASWYMDGVLVFDVTDPTAPVLLGQYDTNDGEITLVETGLGTAPDIRGAWGVWPLGDHIAVGDTERGLIILDFFPVSVVFGD